eukprot:TRINITY_DN34178_c0_g1_i1.p1 TRINITY_DN34178_c0_g1~~TRINITY_DN34178_c0_g1_i1.p1  ORF type:complete len:109 (-),score=37.35 TRINITY_DN34178_c0_g1_i1:119-445(-)
MSLKIGEAIKIYRTSKMNQFLGLAEPKNMFGTPASFLNTSAAASVPMRSPDHMLMHFTAKSEQMQFPAKTTSSVPDMGMRSSSSADHHAQDAMMSHHQNWVNFSTAQK